MSVQTRVKKKGLKSTFLSLDLTGLNESMQCVIIVAETFIFKNIFPRLHVRLFLAAVSCQTVFEPHNCTTGDSLRTLFVLRYPCRMADFPGRSCAKYRTFVSTLHSLLRLSRPSIITKNIHVISLVVVATTVESDDFLYIVSAESLLLP